QGLGLAGMTRENSLPSPRVCVAQRYEALVGDATRSEDAAVRREDSRRGHLLHPQWLSCPCVERLHPISCRNELLAVRREENRIQRTAHRCESAYAATADFP